MCKQPRDHRPHILFSYGRKGIFLFLTGGFSKFNLPNTGNNYRLQDIWSKINIDNPQAILFKCSTCTYMYIYVYDISLILSVVLILLRYRHIARLFIICLWKFDSLWCFFYFFLPSQVGAYSRKIWTFPISLIARCMLYSVGCIMISRSNVDWKKKKG